MKNIILIGLGPHAKRIYYPFLEKYNLEYEIKLRLVIDLEDQREQIEDYINSMKLKPDHVLYANSSQANRMGSTLDPEVERVLTATIKEYSIDGIIISTEPKAHKMYALWALRNDINILMDKPITAPQQTKSKTQPAMQIYHDYLELKQALEQSKARFYIVCQRRNHPGYVYIKKQLDEFVRNFNIPVSYIDIYHADGAWTLPHEYAKENHPYKYGYGKLMHSGYHFVDLFAWLTQSNSQIKTYTPSDMDISTLSFRPNDALYQIGLNSYNQLFSNKIFQDFYDSYEPLDYAAYGELDSFTQIQLLRNNHVITTGSINLQQNSFSRRGWLELPKDTYKGNGRVRHERVTIQASHFLNIQVHSYQSYESGKEAVVTGGAGSEDHFEITIYRNKKMIGGEAFERISLGDALRQNNQNDPYYLGHNEKAREITFLNFLKNQDDASEFIHHELTNVILANMYNSMAQYISCHNPFINYHL